MFTKLGGTEQHRINGLNELLRSVDLPLLLSLMSTLHGTIAMVIVLAAVIATIKLDPTVMSGNVTALIPVGLQSLLVMFTNGLR